MESVIDSQPQSTPNGSQPRCIHEMVADQVERTPDRVAVSCQDRTLTYRQLDDRAEELALVLRAAGVGGGSIVAVLLVRSPELIVALLGIWKAGGAYLYLDPAEPAEQRDRILRDAAAGFAVVDGHTRDLASNIGNVVNLDAMPDRPTGPTGAPAMHPDTPAYVCYTSGSTGEPKGVVVAHRAIHRLVDNPSWMQVRDDDVFLQMTRVGFDVSTFEIWMPLVHGCRLALAPTGHADLEEIVQTLRSERVTVLWLTSGLFHKIVTHHLPGLASIRHLLAGGDVLSPAHVERVLDAHPHLVFTNGYGPTENTTFSTCWTTYTASAAERVPIGVPVDGTTVAILDDAMRPVPPGETGELWVGGPGVATGYLNKPAATAERFVADVDPARPGGRMYRTGDLVRWVDGTLDFLGRRDRQVKIRGYRVELSTVEMELLRQPGVEQAVALTHTDGAGDTRLLAYVAVGSRDAQASAGFATWLREQLSATIATHLVPWAIIVLPDIPLNGNGKVDRSALPAVKVPRNVWNDYAPPTDAIERRLAAIWSDALAVEPVGVDDNFFDLGGHSLLAAELLAALQREFNVNLPARTLYLRPTVTDLAEELRQQSGPGTADPVQEAADGRVG